MSFRDRHGFLRDSEVSGSHTSSHDQYDIERSGEDRFHISTPTRPETRVILESSEIPQNIPSHSTIDPNTSMGYQFVGHSNQRPDTSVLLSDEVISGSLTNGNRMS